MWLDIRTGYSFKQVYGHLDKIAEKCAKFADFGGIADFGNTFAHIPWKKACKKVNIKPIYGVKLPVTQNLQRETRRYTYNWMSLIAKNVAGLQEIYRLVDVSFQQFYYRQRITYNQINETSDNIFVLSGVAPKWDFIEREVFKELSPCTPLNQRIGKLICAAVDNYYVNAEDVWIYEPFAEDRLLERKTTPIHILTYDEYSFIYPDKTPLYNMKKIATQCNVELPKANMVKYVGKDNLVDWCKKGANKKGIDIKFGPYADRFKREIELINEKGYVDYFMMVADAIRYAKTKMSVGPARGCFLPGQRVNTFNGNSRKIEELHIGDKITSSFSKLENVEKVFEYDVDEKILDIEFEDGTKISCTKDHLFLTTDGWIKAEELNNAYDICDVRTESNKLKKLGKLKQCGWNVLAAHKYLKAGYIDYKFYISNLIFFPTGSKKRIKLICEICNQESFVRIDKLSGRQIELKNKPICCKCINKAARNTKSAKLANIKAQLIAQNKPDQIAKNSAAQIKRFNKNWCDYKYDRLFSDGEYREFVRYEYYNNTCQLCNKNKKRMELHHIDDNKDSNLYNIILLCISCHKTYHNNLRYNDKWIETKKIMQKIAKEKDENKNNI